jgi:metal-responsive CopG/Arc/MetJ family transcriptional regulator
MKRISVALERDLYEALDNFCRKRGYTKRGLITYLLREYLKSNGYSIGEPEVHKIPLKREQEGG